MSSIKPSEPIEKSKGSKIIVYNFYDTSSLLMKGRSITEEDQIVISSITLQELEHIKVSTTKSSDIKYQARIVTRFLDEHPELVKIHIFNENMLEPIAEKALELSNDMRILATAIDFDKLHPDDVNFVSNDICLRNLANLFFGDGCIFQVDEEPEEEIKGYVPAYMSDEEMAYFYNHLHINQYNLAVNEYLLIKNQFGVDMDCAKWNGQTHELVPYRCFKSRIFGEVKPKDLYQKMAMESLATSQLTILAGKPGSGKSLLSMAWLMSQLEKGELDHIYIFCNPVPVRGAARLGFYPGTRNDKLLDAVTGNFLASKLGDMSYVEQMIDSGKIILIPLVDCRGVDVGTDSNAAIYVTEAQNMSIDLLKLALQRAGENCQVILDGDAEAQLDLPEYGGSNNGLRRASKVFRGKSLYSKVTLEKIYRSKLAAIADTL